MAYGIIKVIPASAHVEAALSGQGGGDLYPSLKVLNPNDGVVYIARNRDALSTGYGDWDWKVPSQSYALLPGPFSSAGMFYLDQSGAGRQGEITIYPSQQQLDDPMFLSIGRALQAQTTSLDITEGSEPGNPGSGIARLWVDTGDGLHILNSAGVDEGLISTRSLGVITAGMLAPQTLTGGQIANATINAVNLAQYATIQYIGSTAIASDVWNSVGLGAIDNTLSGGTLNVTGPNHPYDLWGFFNVSCWQSGQNTRCAWAVYADGSNVGYYNPVQCNSGVAGHVAFTGWVNLIRGCAANSSHSLELRCASESSTGGGFFLRASSYPKFEHLFIYGFALGLA